MKTLDQLMADYEPERLAEIAKADTPEARERSERRAQEERASEIRRGLRDANGDWIETPESDEDDDEEEDES